MTKIHEVPTRPNQHGNIRGFTLIELLVVITIIGIMAIAAIPSFLTSMRKAEFKNVANNVSILLERARTQAIASEIDMNQKIPPGGYGVWLSKKTSGAQEVILFIDDWNAVAGKDVSMNYANAGIMNRVLPDQIYTTGQDTVLETVQINAKKYIEFSTLTGTKLDGTSWNPPVDAALTVIFQPPYAETTIQAPDGQDLQSFEAELKLKTENITHKIEFNRITTTPHIKK